MDKNTSYLDEAGLKDNSTLIVTIADKATSTPGRPKKAPKEEPKTPIIYTIRGNEKEGE